jgi:hypothetical protein
MNYESRLMIHDSISHNFSLLPDAGNPLYLRYLVSTLKNTLSIG